MDKSTLLFISGHSPVTNLRGVRSPVSPDFLFEFFEAPELSQLFKYYQEFSWTPQEKTQSATACTGIDYNLLRLKDLDRIIFGQPPRGYIIQDLEGHFKNIFEESFCWTVLHQSLR